MTASRWPIGEMHPAQRRYLAEDLMRLRRSDEQRRFVAPQRAGKIDANPHQVEAVVFALGRYREGGCILADEVGLGKTIEAGLVMRQLLAEGARRILLVAPKPLVGQWRQELFQLFGIEAREGEVRAGGFDGDGVFIIGREASGSAKGAEALSACEPFDLCVIDEAHEVFAGIYRRFDKWGVYDDDSTAARTAGRLRDVLLHGSTPVLLLTATPIQNSLTELWGLVQYVDPNGTLLGDLPTFREVFCGQDDRTLAPGLEEELRRRLRVVVQRTLRRQAQDFLDKPFVERKTKLFDYTMSPEERSLYDDVTRYLLEPNIAAFQGNQRRLLLITFLRRMGSSLSALAASLEVVAARLRSTLGDAPTGETPGANEMLADLEDDDEEEEPLATSVLPKSPADIREELQRVERFIARARGLPQDSKAMALQRAIAFVTERKRRGEGSGKIVLFTESIATQEYVRGLLVQTGLMSDEEITLFRGSNDHPRAHEALVRWEAEVASQGERPSRAIAVRLALVHEFKTRTRVFISTEAGAKGLNLQFCETLINYDLPWNPQRIEQRIGRCHRYGQKHQVTVINFLATDNEAQRLTFEILSQKLELFGTVLDASDEVLHRSDGEHDLAFAGSLGAEFENELRRIYDRARSIEEITTELRELRERVAERKRKFEETHARTASIIQDRFDEDVRRVFKQRSTELPGALAEFDLDLERTATAFLDARGIAYELNRHEGFSLLHVPPAPTLPNDISGGLTVAIGPHAEHSSLHLAHPLIVHAIADVRASAQGPFWTTVAVPAELSALRGRRGRLIVTRVHVEGFERVERLVTIVVLDNGEILDSEVATQLLASTTMKPADSTGTNDIDDAAIEEAIEGSLFDLQRSLDETEQRRFERSLEQANRYIEDQIFVRQRQRAVLVQRQEAARDRRDAAIAATARDEAEQQAEKIERELEKLDADIERLERRDDPTFQNFHARIHARRYAPPVTDRLFEMHLVLA